VADNRWRDYYLALYQVAIALGETLETRVVLDRLLKGVIEALHLKGASIRLLTETGLLERVASEGLTPGYLQKGPVEISRSPIDQEALAGRPVQLEDVTTDPRFEYPEAARREGIVSAVFVPLIAQTKPLGVLRVYTGEKRRFTQDELELLVALANLGALAIANARLYQFCVRDQQLAAEALWSFRLPNEFLGEGPQTES